MAGHRISHSEQRWAIMEAEGHPEVRCVAPTRGGTQCKRIAASGSIVCDKHGAYLPNVQKKAKERYVNLADKAREVVESILDNPQASDASKLKAAEMVMRATGMEDAKKVVLDVEADPIEKLFRSLVSDPSNFVDNPPALPAGEGEVVEGEVYDARQEAIDRLEESWQPDAEVRPLRPEDVGTVGPYEHRRTETVNTSIPKDLRDRMPPQQD